MGNFKRYFHLYLIIAFISLVPGSSDGGIIETSTRIQVMTSPDGAIVVSGSIFNTGNEAAYDTTVEIVMAEKRYPAVHMGDNPAGGKLNLDYSVAGEDLLPGHYILVVNIIFEDLSGRRHNAYRFLPLSYRIDDDDKGISRMSIRLNSPRFNLRSPLRLTEKIKITVENETQKTIQPTVELYLADSIMCAQSSIQTVLPPGEKRINTVNIQADHSLTAGSRITALAWWELNGRIYSMKSESELVIVQEPVLFQWYLAICTIILSFLVFRAVKKHHRNQDIARIDPKGAKADGAGAPRCPRVGID